jgi:hypothetical protein
MHTKELKDCAMYVITAIHPEYEKHLAQQIVSLSKKKNKI